MLVQFLLKNVLSFKEETILDMTAINAYKEHQCNLIDYETKEKYLRVAAIYGANASGKSNIYMAMTYFQRIIAESLNNVEDGEETAIQTYYQPFSFDSEKENSEFQIVNILGNFEYKYGFEYNSNCIVTEWLYRKNLQTKRYSTVFERTTEKVEFGSCVRKECEDASAMTITLLLNSEGKKMGKTQKGAVWLDPEKTTPYEFYQYWRNVDDADVLNCMRLLTFLPIEEIDAMKDWEGAQLNKAKEILAYELTKLVHSEEEAKKAEQTAKSIFTGGDSENMPSVEISLDAFKEDVIDIISIVHLAGLVSSRSEARRAIEQGGISINGERVNSIEEKFPLEIFKDGVVVKKGKKSFKKVTVKK